jgi:hypothetical protein
MNWAYESVLSSADRLVLQKETLRADSWASMSAVTRDDYLVATWGVWMAWHLVVTSELY